MVTNRPELNKLLDSDTFNSYYYLKEELIEFCKDNGLPTHGGKIEITERISHFLETGICKNEKPAAKKNSSLTGVIFPTTQIEDNFVCSEKHRAFFKEKIGKSFSFNVQFQKWLKDNSGKTYQDAIDAYYIIKENKKNSKSTIDRQFEYNTYIRDFFENNKGKSLEDAIVCWKYKKSLPGHNRYEKDDLVALEM